MGSQKGKCFAILRWKEGEKMEYLTIIKKIGDYWMGQLIDVPAVKAKEKTREELVESLKNGVRILKAVEWGDEEELVKIDAQKKVRIHWVSVDELKQIECGHGQELYYVDDGDFDEKHLVAFVVDFEWLKSKSDTVEVRLLSSTSSRFADLSVSGRRVIDEVKCAVRTYVPERRLFPSVNSELGPIENGPNLTVRLNG
jgi:hypothetical protein